MDTHEDLKRVFDGIFSRGFDLDPADSEEQLTLTEEEARNGCTKRVPIVRRVVCVVCVDRGACGTCSGIGVVADRRGDLLIQTACPTCHGKPRMFERCGQCVDGFRQREETIELIVSPDTVQGSRISVYGKGDARAGRPPGNRYFVVAIDGQPLGGDHPYRAAAVPRARGETIPARRKSPTSSPAFVLAIMAVLAGGMVTALYWFGR